MEAGQTTEAATEATTEAEAAQKATQAEEVVICDKLRDKLLESPNVAAGDDGTGSTD